MKNHITRASMASACKVKARKGKTFEAVRAKNRRKWLKTHT
jgi:hypothetical protein